MIEVLRCNRCGRILREPAAEVKTGGMTVVYGKTCATKRGLLKPAVPRLFTHRVSRPKVTPQIPLEFA